jgi:fused signal recognition particle receptor
VEEPVVPRGEWETQVSPLAIPASRDGSGRNDKLLLSKWQDLFRLNLVIQTLFGSLNQPEEPQKSKLFDRMKQAMARTRAGLEERVEDLMALSRPVDEQALVQIEESLISADLGVPTVTRILDGLRQKLRRTELQNGEALRSALTAEIEQILDGVTSPAVTPTKPPYILFLVGVNGTGKTTTIGKLAQFLRSDGKTVLLCAADTFRAAAIEQLEVWGQRTGTEVIRTKPGGDPAAVLYDALQAGSARHSDYIIVDTAGRLHNKASLMAELEKMRRTAQRIIPGAPHETLLVMDATTGQNGLQQARLFTDAAAVTGIVLTKLDGTAKGGVVVAISRELGLPVRYVGVGEKVGDLLRFEARDFVDSLFA